jgi:Flp pilus assembly pilin Flp
MKDRFLSFTKDESEVTTVDYGLIAAFIAVVVIMAVTMFASKFSDVAGL